MRGDERYVLSKTGLDGNPEKQPPVCSLYPGIHGYGHDVLCCGVFKYQQRAAVCSGRGGHAVHAGIRDVCDRCVFTAVFVLYQFLPEPQEEKRIWPLQYPGHGEMESGQDIGERKRDERHDLYGRRPAGRDHIFQVRGAGNGQSAEGRGGIFLFAGSRGDFGNVKMVLHHFSGDPAPDLMADPGSQRDGAAAQ